MNREEWEAKQEAKRERYERLAEKHRQEAQSHWKQADQMANLMNGQPILVGHHSEKRHRRDIERMHNHGSKGVEHHKTAEYYDQRAESVGKGGISSDDPDAIEKLEEKLQQMIANQEFMKKANKAIRLKDTEKGDAILLEMGLSETTIYELRNPRYGRIGFKGFELSNNNANIRRVKERIEQLKKLAELEHKEVEKAGITIVQNTDANRVQLIFEGKPKPEIRTRLKRYHGMRWSPYYGAWQRHLNNQGINNANAAVKWIQETYPDGDYYE